MTRHGSATPRKATSVKENSNVRKRSSVDSSLKRRARLLVTNTSIPRQTRSLILYALSIKDPHLAQIVRRVEWGEMAIDHLHAE